MHRTGSVIDSELSAIESIFESLALETPTMRNVDQHVFCACALHDSVRLSSRYNVTNVTQG